MRGSGLLLLLWQERTEVAPGSRRESETVAGPDHFSPLQPLLSHYLKAGIDYGY